MNDGTKLTLAFISSFVLSMIVIIINAQISNCKKKREFKESLRNEVFMLCEKILLYAYRANYFSLRSIVHYKYIEEGLRLEIEKSNYLKYKSDSEDCGLQRNLLEAELLFKIGQMEDYWSSWEYREIKKLALKRDVMMILHYENVFKGIRKEEEIDAVFAKQIEAIHDYLYKKSDGKNLLKIQETLYPAIIKGREGHINTALIPQAESL